MKHEGLAEPRLSTTPMADFDISIVIPTYNRAEQVGVAIDSALSQSFPAKEIIVADDGSKDDTAEMIRRNFPQVRLMSGENRGKSEVVNGAIRESKGSWIAILDDDDSWEREKLFWQVRALGEFRQAGLCFTRSRFINNPSMREHSFVGVKYQFAEVMGVVSNPADYVLNPPHGIYIQSCLIKKELLRAAGGFDKSCGAADDTDMIFKLALITQFAYVNRSMTNVDRKEVRKSGLTDSRKDNPRIYLNAHAKMYSNWLRILPLDKKRHRDIISRRLSDIYNSCANLSIAQGDLREGSRFLDMAILGPSRWTLWLKRLIFMCIPWAIRSYISFRFTHERRFD